MKKKSMLVISHGHPDFRVGGAEVVAYALYHGYQQSDFFTDCYFLANKNKNLSGQLSLYKHNEYLWEQGSNGMFSVSTVNTFALFNNFRYFLEKLKPDFVHIHHYINFGLEIIKMIKNILPKTKIILTLHEYIGICPNSGQMLKTDNHLCYQSGYDFCVECLPQFSKEDIWQRKTRFLYYFSLVDRFIAPSNFLRQRYIEWGLQADKIVTIENGLRAIEKQPPRTLKKQEHRTRFAFFGQMNTFKGLDFLLEVLTLLPDKIKKQISFEVNGANLSTDEKFQQKIFSLREKLEDESFLRWRGSYYPNEIAERMKYIDWVVVPSLWWENSPVVIQEAFACGRPLIVSNIGGMAEKVRNGIDGVHVAVQNHSAWIDCLCDTCGNDELFDRLVSNIKQPPSIEESVQAHLALFRQL